MKFKNLLLGCLSTLLLGTGIGYSQKEVTTPNELEVFYPGLEKTRRLPLVISNPAKLVKDAKAMMYDQIRIKAINEARNYSSNDSLDFKNYDPALRVMIPNANENFDLGPVLSDRFAQFLEPINRDLASSHYIDKTIKIKCKAHAAIFNKKTEADTVIMFTHPLYLHLSSWDYITTDSLKMQTDQYLERFVHLLHTIPRDRFDVAVFEGMAHYAAATNLLLENGLIDKVYFTDDHSGRLPKSTDISELEGKVFFVAGGYNDLCLESSNSELLKITNYSNIFAIQGLCLDDPYGDDKNLLSDRVYCGGDGPLQMIKYKDFLKVIN